MKWGFFRDSIGTAVWDVEVGERWKALGSAIFGTALLAQGRSTRQGHGAGIHGTNTGKGHRECRAGAREGAQGRTCSPPGSTKQRVGAFRPLCHSPLRAAAVPPPWKRSGRVGRRALLCRAVSPPIAEGWDETLLKAPSNPAVLWRLCPPFPSSDVSPLSPSGLPAHRERNAPTVWAPLPSAPSAAPRSPSDRLLTPRPRSSPWCRRRPSPGPRIRRSNRLRSRQTIPARARGGSPACRGDPEPIGAPRTDLNAPLPPIAAPLVGRRAGPAPRPV